MIEKKRKEKKIKKKKIGRGQLRCDEATPTGGAEAPRLAMGVATLVRDGKREEEKENRPRILSRCCRWGKRKGRNGLWN